MSPSPAPLRGALAALLLVPLVLVFASGWFAMRSDRTARESERTMDRLQRERLDLESLQTALTDMQTGQRGYLLTSDAMFLEIYEQAEPTVAAILQELTASGSVPALMPQLRQLVEAKLSFLRENIAAVRAGDRARAKAAVSSGEGQRRMDAVRKLVHEWEAETERALAAQRRRLDRDLDRVRWATQGAVFIQLLLCGLASWAVWRWWRLHGLVTMCAWSRTIQHRGEWMSFEEYLRREFGIRTTHGMSPEQVKRFTAQLHERETKPPGD